MLEFILAPGNIPFSTSLAVMFIIAFLEGVGSLFGAGISNVFGALFPDMDIELDADGGDLESPGVLGRLLSWLRVGEVPVLVLLVVFFTAFGLSGYLVQKLSLDVFGLYLPALVAIVPATIVSIPMVRGFGGVLGAILPKDETDAVSHISFIGRVAKVTLGEAKTGSPAQAKVRDTHGKYHYIMVEPDQQGTIFSQGEDVLVVRNEDTKFFAIRHQNDSLGTA